MFLHHILLLHWIWPDESFGWSAVFDKCVCPALEKDHWHHEPQCYQGGQSTNHQWSLLAVLSGQAPAEWTTHQLQCYVVLAGLGKWNKCWKPSEIQWCIWWWLKGRASRSVHLFLILSDKPSHWVWCSGRYPWTSHGRAVFYQPATLVRVLDHCPPGILTTTATAAVAMVVTTLLKTH